MDDGVSIDGKKQPLPRKCAEVTKGKEGANLNCGTPEVSEIIQGHERPPPQYVEKRPFTISQTNKIKDLLWRNCQTWFREACAGIDTQKKDLSFC